MDALPFFNDSFMCLCSRSLFPVDPGYISYPPVSSSHPPWGSSLEKGGAGGGGGHWEYGGSRRDRERDREMERERERERDRTPTTSEYSK